MSAGFSAGFLPSGPVRIMFDLETLSTRSDANVVSIGAVVFGSQSKARADYPKEFYINVEDPAGHIDLGTVFWWLAQSREAQQRLLTDRVDLHQALFRFFMWCSMHATGDALGLQNMKPKDVDVEFWSRSPSFDEVILGSAYRRAETRSPFYHRWSRDHRTIEVAARLPYEPKGGLAHDALSDSYQQAEHVLACLVKLAGNPLPNLMGGS